MCIRILLTVFCFIVCCDFVLTSRSSYKYFYNGASGRIKYSIQDNLMIYCNKQDGRHISMTDAFPPSNFTLPSTNVTINQCLPNTSYEEELKALNINTSEIDSLTLIFNLKKPLPRGNFTAGLKIRHLSVKNDNYENIFKNTEDFFEPLSDLKSLYVSGIVIPPLPESMRLITLNLNDSASVEYWGNCGYLKRVYLSRFIKNDFPVWPGNCTQLEHLEIEYLLPETAIIVTERMAAAAPSLRTLKISNCRLHDLPLKMLSLARNLVYLDLSKNKLYDELFRIFPFHDTLKTLDLSMNPIHGNHIFASLMQKLPSLVEIILRSMNDLYKVCMDEKESVKNNIIAPLHNSSIEHIDFGDTYLYVDCIEKFRFINLKRITMLQAASAQFKLLNLPQTDARHLEIDFGNSHFIDIWFDEADYDTLRIENATSPYNGRNLSVWTGFVNCDCKHGWLARALRDFPHIISMPNLRCFHDHGNHILDEPKGHLECNKTGRDWCFYRQSWKDGTVTGECEERAWIEMKPVFPLHGLNVSGKGISTLNTMLPDSIQWIDLRDNSISRGSAEEAAALFAAGRRVWLADNLLLCECVNRALLDAIQLHKEQVEDYDLLQCVGTGELLSSISTAALCQVALVASLSVCGALVVVAGVIAVLLRRYGEQLRMFLYSRGWCMSCLQRQEPDDKPYDAFISFAHEDREYVMETLLPGLENAPERFRVCVHYRDWLVGDWIPAQIMRSVQLSKRTLILMSRNFVASPWSTLEFRYSIAHADEDINTKVLVLIKDDVLDLDFSMELRSYLTYNTYLECDDPWFWEKLRYAMPHRVQNESLRTEYSDIAVRFQALHMGNSNVAIEFPTASDNDLEDNVVDSGVQLT